MDNWNPMAEDFHSINFNSYDRGPGALLPISHLPSYKRQTKQTTEKCNTTLYISRIPICLEEDGLRNVFSKYGHVLRVFRGIPRQNIRNGLDPQCFGFITYSTLQEAENAIRELDGKPPLGLKVVFSMSPEEKAEKDMRKQQESKRYQEKHQYQSFHDESQGNKFKEPLIANREAPLLPLQPYKYHQEQERYIELQGEQVSNLKVTTGSTGRTVSCNAENVCHPHIESRTASVRKVHEYFHGNHTPCVLKTGRGDESCAHHCGHNPCVDHTHIVQFVGSGDAVERYIHKRYDNSMFQSCSARQDAYHYSQNGYHCRSGCCTWHCSRDLEESYPYEYNQIYNNRPDHGHRQNVNSNKRDVEIQVELNSDSHSVRCSPVATSVQTNYDNDITVSNGHLNKKTDFYGSHHVNAGTLCQKNQTKVKNSEQGKTSAEKQKNSGQKPNLSNKTESIKSNDMNQKTAVSKNEKGMKKRTKNIDKKATDKQLERLSFVTSSDKINSHFRDSETFWNEDNKLKSLLPCPMNSHSNKFSESSSSGTGGNTVNSKLQNGKLPQCKNSKPMPLLPNLLNSHSVESVCSKQVEKNLSKEYCKDSKESEDASQSQVTKQSVSSAENLEGFIEVTVSYFVNPNEIWLHRINKLQVLQKVTEELQTLDADTTPLQSSCVGDLCAAVYSLDGLWYRARIDKVNGDGTFEVCYVDFGNRETVKSSQLTQLSTSLLAIHPLAVPCQLSDICPPNGSSVWSAESYKTLTNMMSNTTLKAKKVHIGSDKIVNVELIDKEGNNIAEQLVTLGLADWINKAKQPLITETIDTTPMTSSLHQRTIEETSPTSPKTLPEPTSIPLPCEPQEIPLESTPVSSSESAQEITPLPHSSPELRVERPAIAHVPSVAGLLSVNEYVEISIVVKDDKSFWAVAALTDVINKLYEVEQAISTECSTHKENYRPSKGEIVAAFSPNDQYWYRASVLKVDQNEYVVRYVDYGNEETVSETQPLLASHVSAVSPVLYCTSSDQLILPELFVGTTLECTVTCVNESKVSFEVIIPKKASVLQITAQPWYHDLNFLDLAASDSDVSSDPNMEIDNTLSSQMAEPEVGENIEQRIMQNKMKKLDLMPEDSFEVIMAWAEFAGNIYVQKVSLFTDLCTMLEDLNTWCQNCPETSYTPVKNEIVCAKFSKDNIWYRASVSDISASCQCTVQFVDYGNTEEITFDNIRPLPFEFLSYPLFGIHVALDRVPGDMLLPEDVRLANKIWILEVVNTENYPFRVILKDQTGNDLLSNIAISGEASSFEDKHLESTTSPVNQDGLSEEKVSKLPSISKSSEQISFDDMTYFEFPIGKSLKVVLSTVYKPNSFFCSPLDEELNKPLLKIKEDIAKFCNATLPEDNCCFNMGEMCLAKFSDGDWHRVLAIDQGEDEAYLDVDSGKIEVVDKFNLRKMINQFTKFPMQAVPCTLPGKIDELPEKVSEQLTATLQSLSSVEVKVIDKIESSEYIVDIPSVTKYLTI